MDIGIRRSVLGLVLMLAAQPAAWGLTYFVAKNGDDAHPGAEQQPWLTIGKAAQTAAPGDTVFVKAGVYDEKVRFANDGREDAWITYKAFGNDDVAIDYSGTDDHVVLFNKAYIILDGFKVNSARFQPVRLNPGSHHVVIRNCELSGAVAKALKCPKCGENITLRIGEGISYHGLLIEDDSVHHVVIQNNKIYGHGLTRHHHGMYIKGDHHLIEGNTISGNAHAGIHLYNDKGSVRHCVVRNNILYSNGLRSGSGPGIIVTQGSNLIYNNVCYGNGGHGIFVFNVPPGDPPNKIFNNVLYDNGRAGIALENSPATMVKNNICLDNRQHNLFAIGSAGAALDNNCFFPDGEGRFMWSAGAPQRVAPEGRGRGQGAPEGGRGAAAGVSTDFAGYKAASGQDAHSLCQDPKFRSAKEHDFHLHAGSPCVDAGAAVEAESDFEGRKRPQGKGFDIGAFESPSGT